MIAIKKNQTETVVLNKNVFDLNQKHLQVFQTFCLLKNIFVAKVFNIMVPSSGATLNSGAALNSQSYLFYGNSLNGVYNSHIARCF